MLEQQIRPSDVLNPRVLKAFESLKREQFLDAELSGLAYSDTALPIGFGQVMLPPVIDGRLLQVLNVQDHEGVLEIGTGTGYFTALLAQLSKWVTSVDIVAELSECALQNLQQLGINNVSLCIGDASQAWPLDDRIDVIVSTAAFTVIPDSYLQSLKVGGRMLAVVGEDEVMTAVMVTRVSEREWNTESHFETAIPAMINAEPKAKFEF
ncbi:MAG: protein-L-isoaspartate O-methyltransferase [Gammaproteobacteria bacterium]|nr:MAG: protein-L-isoaspartate O-methyltransferase [Gammaproteobacteria bacterium]